MPCSLKRLQYGITHATKEWKIKIFFSEREEERSLTKRKKKKKLVGRDFVHHAYHSRYQTHSSESLQGADYGSHRKLKHSCFNTMSLCQKTRGQDDGIETDLSGGLSTAVPLHWAIKQYSQTENSSPGAGLGQFTGIILVISKEAQYQALFSLM